MNQTIQSICNLFQRDLVKCFRRFSHVDGADNCEYDCTYLIGCTLKDDLDHMTLSNGGRVGKNTNPKNLEKERRTRFIN